MIDAMTNTTTGWRYVFGQASLSTVLQSLCPQFRGDDGGVAEYQRHLIGILLVFIVRSAICRTLDQIRLCRSLAVAFNEYEIVREDRRHGFCVIVFDRSLICRVKGNQVSAIVCFGCVNGARNEYDRASDDAHAGSLNEPLKNRRKGKLPDFLQFKFRVRVRHDFLLDQPTVF